MSNTKLATKTDLQEMYQRILPYLGGSADAGFTPIGTIIAVMGNNAPANYLACNGQVVNIADYPELANYFEQQFGSKNHFGGDGTTTFGIVDLSGEFLRGTGTNSHAQMGNGADVGVHQDASGVRDYWIRPNGSSYHLRMTEAEYQQALSSGYPPLVWPKDSSATDFTKYRDLVINGTLDPQGTNPGDYNTLAFVRPTNTSVLFCIATKNIYMGGGGSSLNYSTDEQVVGTWIDGKPIYQKTIHETITTYSDNEHRRTFVSSAIANVDTLVFSENAYIDQYGGWVHETYSLQFVAQRTVYTYLNLETHDLDCRAQYNNQLNPITSVTLNCTVRYTKTTD